MAASNPYINEDNLPAAFAAHEPRAAEPVVCSFCWEPITHDGAIWRHVRTGRPAMWNDRQCAPLCHWPDCQQDADPDRSLGSEEWTGSAFRYRAKRFFCAAHWDRYRTEQGAIVRT